MARKVTKYWFKYYVKNTMCSLCGQSGIIDTTGLRSPVGIDCGQRNYCIYPNGQALRKGNKAGE